MSVTGFNYFKKLERQRCVNGNRHCPANNIILLRRVKNKRYICFIGSIEVDSDLGLWGNKNNNKFKMVEDYCE